MGYSITAEQAAKLAANRAAGRACKGGHRDCAVRATRKVTSEAWTYKIGEGASHTSTLTLCGRHAKGYVAGFEGVNFRVVSVEAF